MIFVISTPKSTSTSSFDSWKKKFFFQDTWGGPHGTKMVNVDFQRIKLKKVITNEPLFKPDTNKLILMGAAKWPYPPSSFSSRFFRKPTEKPSKTIVKPINYSLFESVDDGLPKYGWISKSVFLKKKFFLTPRGP